jgi:hypothetical protein
MLKRSRTFLKDQGGVALVIALIMVVLLTLISLASVSTTIFELRLSGNKRGMTDAFLWPIVAQVAAQFSKLRSSNDVTNQYKYSQDASNINPTDYGHRRDTMRSGPPGIGHGCNREHRVYVFGRINRPRSGGV